MIVTESRCKDISTTFPYLDRSTVYRSQKPFATDFIPRNPNVPLSNHTFDYMDLVVTDAQPLRDCFSLEINGFCFLKSETALRDKNISVDDPEYVETHYFAEIEALLHRTFPEYTRLECLDHQVNIGFERITQTNEYRSEREAHYSHTSLERLSQTNSQPSYLIVTLVLKASS